MGAIVARFLGVNTLVQAAALVTGILVVRGLDKSDYGLYAVFTAFVAAFVLLSDSGLSAAVVGEGAEVRSDPAALGGVFRTAFRLQRRVAIPQVFLGAAGLLTVLVLLGGAPFDVAALTVGFLLSAIPLSMRSISVAYRRLTADYSRLQVVSAATSAVRLLLVGALSVLSKINLLPLAMINALATSIEVVLARMGMGKAVPLRGPIDQRVHEKLKGVYFRALPLSLGIVVQTQMVTVVTGLVGGTDILAEIAALSRFAAVLAVFAALVNDIGQGVIARTERARRSLLRAYLTVVGLFATVCFSITGVLAIFATPLLALLGPGYAGLEGPLIVVALGTSGIMLADAMRSLNNSLGWVAWSWLYVPLMGIWLLAGLFLFDLTDVVQAAWWMASQALIGLSTQIVVMLTGLARTSR